MPDIDTTQDCTVEAHKPTVKEFFGEWFARIFGKFNYNDSNMTDHAMEELKQAGFYDADSDYGGMLAPAVMRLVQCHAKEGHSGFSSAMVAQMFAKLVDGEPLTPLTGVEEEWSEWYEGDVRQNKRCSKIFQTKAGRAYTLDAVVFVDPNGATFTSSDSLRDIEFPYMPPAKPEFVNHPPKEVVPGNPVAGDTFIYKDEAWRFDGEFWMQID